jgi:hypothetical protein
MTQPFVLLVCEKDCDQSQIHHVFKKYHIDNAIHEVEYLRVMTGYLNRKKEAFPEPPEFMIVSIKPGASKLISLLHELTGKDLFSEIPIIVMVETMEECDSVNALGLKKAFCMMRPMGYFKLLEALQKLEMHWLVFKR